MSGGDPWFDRVVDRLSNSAFFAFVAGRVLVPFWAWRTPVAPQPGGPRDATQPGENLQRLMNLVMPLKDKTAIGRAKAAQAIAANLDEIMAGLDNVGNVHFARFVLLDNKLCMFSEYDGDFTNYIRDFVAQIGSVFDGVVALIEGGDAVIPTEDNIEAFIDWVRCHDLYQFPDQVTDILAYGKPAAAPGSDLVDDDLRLLPRALILQLNVNPDVSLGGYRAYPGISAAQIRQQAGMGW
ncbi:MAG TPA: hypothetical protein VM900_08360 [Sphingomonas sp.]|jgi:hypothetical protein|nr:hypothetical protein [Sphingomonas sp.]